MKEGSKKVGVMHCKHSILIAVIMAFFFSALFGGQTPQAAGSAAGAGFDSPQNLGINLNGVSPETGLLHSWPEGGPKALWRAPIKMGWSCPSVAGDDVVLIMAEFVEFKDRPKDGGERVACFSAATGKKKWETAYKTDGYFCGWWQGGPRGTPAITEDAVYTIGMMGHLTRLDRKTGKIIWQFDFGKEILSVQKLGKLDHKGYSQSPILIGDIVSIPVFLENGEAAIEGIDVKTGKLAWTYKDNKPPDKGGWDPGTLAIIEINNQKCFFTYLNKGFVAINPADGKKVLKSQVLYCRQSLNPAPPMVYGSKILFVPVTSPPIYYMELSQSAGAPQLNVLWQKKDLHIECNYVPFIRHNGAIFGYNNNRYNPNDFNGRTCSIVCIDEKTGNTLWNSPEWLQPFSMIAADGLLFVRTFKTLRLVEATTAGYKELGRIENLHDGKGINFDGPSLVDCVLPVIANGKLYIRLPAELLCLDIKNN